MLRKISHKLFGQREEKDDYLAVNANSKPLYLNPDVSKVFGMPDKITTNLAFDKF